MRALVVALTTISWLSTAVLGAQGFDVQGTARTSGRPQPNTVVWLEVPGAAASTSAKKVTLDQRNLSFSPRVLAVRVGTSVEFPNNDRVFHNVFSFRDGRVFDLGLYPVGTVKYVTFDKPGLSRLFCNIHPNMAAYILAVDSPYFAVADGLGAFVIREVPAAKYVYRTWRPGGEIEAGSVTVERNSELEIERP
jgi:plastocyanin